ncbi:MAG TPA: DUF4271 domain-containing protein [Puia sp.]|nr:DUF4271 domain-containing protein [Puia sp.]
MAGKDSSILKSAPVQKDSSDKLKDTTATLLTLKKHAAHRKKDSSVLNMPDSLFPKKNLENNIAIDRSVPDSTVFTIQGSSHEGGIISFKKVLADNRYFNFLGKSLVELENVHITRSYDGLFYLLVGILFYFAFIKFAFARYLSNLFTLFFRVSMRQQQIREQVLQSPLPSLLLNILFIVAAGLYGVFIARFFQIAPKAGFWILYLNFAVILIIAYLVKFVLLKITGWIFNIQRATDTYIFIIFLTNKILGVFLLPFLIMLSFSGTFVDEIAVTVSCVMVFTFYMYRFIATYGSIRKEIKMNGFHFFLYLCAFEIAPLLLIYKVLLNYLEKAY